MWFVEMMGCIKDERFIDKEISFRIWDLNSDTKAYQMIVTKQPK